MLFSCLLSQLLDPVPCSIERRMAQIGPRDFFAVLQSNKNLNIMFILIMKAKTNKHQPKLTSLLRKLPCLTVHITEGDETILTQKLHSTDPF